ncbi:MAG: phosphoenolpyruvate--protein phosphotransferase [Spirochaetota bacterium]
MKLKGIGISGTISWGKVFLYLQESYSIPKYNVFDVSSEINRFINAINKTIEDINKIKQTLETSLSNDELFLYTSFILFLNDPNFISLVTNEIRKGQKNAEWALYVVLEELISKFQNLPNISFAQRSEDISSIGEKIMMNLLAKQVNSEKLNIPPNSIIVARSISPTDPIILEHKNIAGLITELGGYASHTAIMTRSLSIPSVLGVEFITSIVQNDDELILNPLTGEVILKPTEEEFKEAKALQSKQKRLLANFHPYTNKESKTLDNVSIDILANIAFAEEIPSLLKTSAKGIGLYRSEFIVLQSNSFPPEETQYKVLKKIFSTIHPDKEITIRTLDLGGDKIIPGYASANEKNPFLGYRAIRFCLSRPKLFLEQIRSILRAAYNSKNLKIMIPMVSNYEEIIETKKLFKQAIEELEKENIPFCKNFKLGIMFEIPSVYYILDELAKEIDFISIGTNDLIQYILACDRGNEKVAYLFRYSNPSVLRFLNDTIKKAIKLGLEVSMCGEMASDIYSIPLLLGMGLRRFSIPPSSFMLVNKLINNISLKECEKLTEEILKLISTYEIEEKVNKWIKERAYEVYEFFHLLK